jgi:hypothetical protein
MRNFQTDDEDGGYLRDDGQVRRVPMMLRDSNWQDTADTIFARRAGGNISAGDGLTGPSLHRPGFRVAVGDTGRDAREKAYQTYESEIAVAYKTPTGAGSNGPRSSPEAGDPCSAGSDSRIDARDAAYSAYDDWLANQWKTSR